MALKSFSIAFRRWGSTGPSSVALNGIRDGKEVVNKGPRCSRMGAKLKSHRRTGMESVNGEIKED